MTDMYKPRLKPLDIDSDYDLWRIRIESILDDKGLTDVCATEDGESESSAAAASIEPSVAACRKKAKAIIVIALGESALRSRSWRYRQSGADAGQIG